SRKSPRSAVASDRNTRPIDARPRGGCRAPRAPQARSARRMGSPDRDSGMTPPVRGADLVAPVYDPCTGSLPWSGREEAVRSLDLRAPFLGAAPKAGGE